MSAVPAKPKRLSLSEILELLLTRERPQHSGVTLSRGRQGETLVEVTVKVGDEGVTSPADAETMAREMYDRLTGEYPAANGTYAGSSIDLSRNAKGEPQLGVTIKAGDNADAHGLALAEAAAIEAFDRLRTRYPMSSGLTGASPEPVARGSRSKGGEGGGQT